MSSGFIYPIWEHVSDVDCEVVDEQRKRFAYVLRSAREQRGLGAQELADALGIGRTTLHSWESGEKAPSILMLGPLCAALGVSPELFRDLPAEPPSPVESYLLDAAHRGVRRAVRRSEP